MKMSGFYWSLAAVLLAVCSLNGNAAEPKWTALTEAIDPSKQQIAGQWTKTANDLSVKAEHQLTWWCGVLLDKDLDE